MNFAHELINASSKNAVSPNADTLYGYAWLDLLKEPARLRGASKLSQTDTIHFNLSMHTRIITTM